MRYSNETALALQDQSRSIHVRQIIQQDERGVEQRLNYLTPEYYQIDYRRRRRLYLASKLICFFAMFILPEIIMFGIAAFVNTGLAILLLIIGSPTLFLISALTWPSNYFQEKRNHIENRKKAHKFTSALEPYQRILDMNITPTYVSIRFVNSMGYEQYISYNPHDMFEAHKRYNDGSLNSYRTLDLTTGYYEYCYQRKGDHI